MTAGRGVVEGGGEGRQERAEGLMIHRPDPTRVTVTHTFLSRPGAAYRLRFRDGMVFRNWPPV